MSETTHLETGLPRARGLAVGAVLAGMVAAWLIRGAGPERLGFASAAAGACLALAIMAATAAAARWALRRGPVVFWQVQVIGVLMRMIVVGAGVAVAALSGWVKPVPFAVVLLVVYLSAEAWLALAQQRVLQARPAGN